MFWNYIDNARRCAASLRENHGSSYVRTPGGHRRRWFGAFSPEARGALETVRAFRQLAHFCRRLEAW